jgi:large subunit ribosomal protein L47
MNTFRVVAASMQSAVAAAVAVAAAARPCRTSLWFLSSTRSAITSRGVNVGTTVTTSSSRGCCRLGGGGVVAQQTRQVMVGRGQQQQQQQLYPRATTSAGSSSTTSSSSSSNRRLFHTSRTWNMPLDEFRDVASRTDRATQTVGRPWSVMELRRKSYHDLQKLWLVLYKERNMLLTEQQLSRRRELTFPQPERFQKVQRSMAAIRHVLGERKRNKIAEHAATARQNQNQKEKESEKQQQDQQQETQNQDEKTQQQQQQQDV